MNQSKLPHAYRIHLFAYRGLRQNRANLKPYIPNLYRDDNLCTVQLIGSVCPR